MRSVALDPRDIRIAAALLVGGAALLPELPGHPGYACPLRTVTGIPCPLCGMTTSVEEMVRLDLGDALAANPAGVAAVAGALLVLVLRPRRLAIPAALPPIVLAAMWAFELHRFSFI